MAGACAFGHRPLGFARFFARGIHAMGGFILPIIRIIIDILELYKWIVIIQAVTSWLIAFNILNTHSRPVSMIVDFLYRVTEPALRPIRQFLPNLGGLDISPIILFLIILFVEMELENLGVYLLMH
jgi:YggT family protein